MSDPVGPRAAPIMSHMNKDHKEAMVAIVSHRLPSLPRPPRTARMIAIDASGFTLEYRIVRSLFWNPSGEAGKVRIPFSPAIKAESEVRQRIIAIAKEAETKRRRQYAIAYSPPRDLPIWIVINALMLFISRPDIFQSLASRSPFSLDLLNSLLVAVRARLPNGAASMEWLFRWLLSAHAAEATAMAVYSWYRGARGTVWLRWVVSHFFIGFTTFSSFQKLNPAVPVSIT